MTALRIAQIAVGGLVFGAVAVTWITGIGGAARREQLALRAQRRAYRAHYAAVEAAEEEAAFSPEAIEQAVTDAVRVADRIWHGTTSGADRDRPDWALLKAWARSQGGRLAGPAALRGKPEVKLLRVVNRPGEEEDRVEARVRGRIHWTAKEAGPVGLRQLGFDERWMLGRSGQRWTVLSVQGDPLAAPVLSAPLIPSPSYDEARLHTASLAELADAQRVDGDTSPAELVDADAPPRAALLDLSVVDPRFAPDLIAGELAQLVELWEEAATGSPEPLAARASAEACHALLRPAHGAHLVVRDAVVRSWEPTQLHLDRRPPAIEIFLEVAAVRFVELKGDHLDRIGNECSALPIFLRWTLELAGPQQAPWQLTASSSPAKDIVGWGTHGTAGGRPRITLATWVALLRRRKLDPPGR